MMNKMMHIWTRWWTSWR